VILESRVGQPKVVETRTQQLFGSSTPPTWAQLSGGLLGAGRVVSTTQAVTVPTILGALQFISGTTAQLPMIVYEDLGDHKLPRYDLWQYRLMETYPGPNTDPFQWKYDTAWCLESEGNAFLLKIKDPKTLEVIELIVLDPDRVMIRNENGVKKFDVKVDNRTVFKGATVNEILHIKNLPKPGTMWTGTSPLKLITARLGAEISASEWEGRFFDNDATPPIVITLGEDAGAEEMREAYESWQVAHAGPYNAGKPAVLAGGAKVEKLGSSIHDAQLIDAHTFNVMDFSRAMNLPITLFIPPHTKPQAAEDEALLFATFYLGPRLRRIESAINSDPDFFAYNEYWCKFDERAMMRANTTAMALANHSYVQDGVLLPDEVRAELGYAPLPPLLTPEEAAQNPGKIPQITPVGGAPNDILADQQLADAVKKGDKED